MGPSRLIPCALAFLAATSPTQAAGSITLPGYGTFIGTTINQTLTKKSLPNTVDAWLGIDYASQPIGEKRFAPVGSPLPFAGEKNATNYGFSCIQDPAMVSYDQDEACLSMNVFRPRNVSSGAKLPVLIWIHGVRKDMDLFKVVTNKSRAASSPEVREVSTAQHLSPTLNYHLLW